MHRKAPYAQFALCTEMVRSVDVVQSFDPARVEHLRPRSDRVLLTGEGSSRIFPAKRLIAQALRERYPQHLVTEAATQAAEYCLDGYHVYVASNSGKTAEGVHLIRSLRAQSWKPASVSGIVANPGTPIAEESDQHVVLSCGPEHAVAATMSVIEQALVYDSVFRSANGAAPVDFEGLSAGLEQVLSMTIESAVVDAAASASTLYFAGRNDGVAEELTLKANEITRKPSDFLEGTYAVHGIEEIMQPNQVVIVVEPYEHQEEKFSTVLERGVGMRVIAIATRPTRFPTIRIPQAGDLTPYLLLAAGWNLLVEVGLALGVDLDKPTRARKVGNEFGG